MNRGITGMSDFTVDDTMAEIRYELDDREIYNDIRSEIGILISETVVDEDATYSWKVYSRSVLVSPPYPHIVMFTTRLADPLAWRISRHNAADADGRSYYDYKIKLLDTDDDRTKAVKITNTGSKVMRISFAIKVKYKTGDKVTHEELFPETLTVRVTDATSIKKYGRRVMNLTWTEGTEENDMQALVDNYKTRYAEPVARISCVIKGTTDVLRTQIITREITDIITVICTNLDLNADCFINSITITDDPVGIPVCTWGLEIQRAYELLTLFLLDTSELDGPHILGS